MTTERDPRLFQDALPKFKECMEVVRQLLKFKEDFYPLSEEEMAAAIALVDDAYETIAGQFWNGETHTGSPEEEMRKGNSADVTSSPLALAKFMHETYERLAPNFGYETRTDTKKFDPESPNGKLMQAVCEKVLKKIEEEDE